MSLDSFRLIAKYLAKDPDGVTYEVNEYQEFKRSVTLDGEEWIPGLKELRLNSGGRVNHVDDNTFEIVQSGTILNRITG